MLMRIMMFTAMQCALASTESCKDRVMHLDQTRKFPLLRHQRPDILDGDEAHRTEQIRKQRGIDPGCQNAGDARPSLCPGAFVRWSRVLFDPGLDDTEGLGCGCGITPAKAKLSPEEWIETVPMKTV
jgi:hypothetical protein